jgi:hypothetical protein
LARATTIWVVLDEQSKVIAGFTVQHRLAKWLKTIDFPVTLVKVRDENPETAVVFVSVEDVQDQ